MAGVSVLSVLSVVRKLLISSSRNLPVRSSGAYSISHHAVHDDSHSKDKHNIPAVHDDSQSKDGHNIPPRPKRPLSGFFRYYKEIYPFMKNSHPGVKMPVISKQIAEEWHQLQPADKKKYEDAYRKDKENYSIELSKWKEELTEAQKIQIQETKAKEKISRLEKKMRRARGAFKKVLVKSGKPKRPVSSFLLFVQEKRQQHHDSNYKELLKSVSEEWKKMSEAEKRPYIEKFSKEKAAYGKKLSEWEEEMIRADRQDILANTSNLRAKRRTSKKNLKGAKENEE